MCRLTAIVGAAVFVCTAAVDLAHAAEAKAKEGDLAAQLRELTANVLPADEGLAKRLRQMLAQDMRGRRTAANQRETKNWRAVQTRADWERYRDVRIQALRESLGQFPAVPRDLHVRITRTLEGDGYRIENLVFESRPGLIVTANLYQPAKPPTSMPGILIVHSHHNPKTQGELQDMGMTWARLGCLVLVMDQIGHGERRQHPFRGSEDYPRPFKVGRQDYYFRYNVGMQLHLIGDSLIGWMAWDLMRGVDLLLARPGIDKERIILLGSVAGGGDPAAVAAALDQRITAVVPFNFGGPQPESTYPLPADAEQAFNYAGSGSWESTRNLRLSARDGFFPWVIVGSVAPRRLLYGHEFAWDQARDPVWARLEKVYSFYDAPDHLAATHGRGQVTGKPPESTHCNNIGPVHRKGIYPALKRWFDIAEPDKEYQQRHKQEELLCLAPEAAKPRPLYELAAEMGAERTAAARERLVRLTPEMRRQELRQVWGRLLGDVEPAPAPKVSERRSERVGGVSVERILLHVERELTVPLLLLVPSRKAETRLPVVVGFAQEGKQAFLKNRAETIAALLDGGAAVCLPDVRGTGETRPADDSRGRQSTATGISSNELMLGQTLVGSRLQDLRSVLRYLRTRPEIDPSRIALWGDSFAPVNPPDRNVKAPLDADDLPNHAEPLGGLLALFGALYERDVRAVYAQGGLTGYQSLLHSPFCYVPHDVIVPGALTAGDLGDVAALLAPRPLRLEGMVDGLNRRVPAEALAEAFGPARTAYRAASAGDRLHLVTDRETPDRLAKWFLTNLASGN
jgi:cephalosporin-C deacetylase-like acetyl esterase